MALLVSSLSLAPATGASAAHWRVIPEKSTLGFAGAAGGMPFAGRFARFDARIDFDPADPARGHVEVSIDTASAVTGDRERDTTLPQPAWFNVKMFPRATFTVRLFRPKGGHDYDALGTLEMRGVVKPVMMPVMIDVAGETLHASGHLDIKRTDYGVGEGVGAQWVALDVAASFDITARQLRE